MSPDASDNLMHQFISELEQLTNAEALANWARRALPLKSQLSTADALAIEGAFTARLSQLGELEPATAKGLETNGRDDPSMVD